MMDSRIFVIVFLASLALAVAVHIPTGCTSFYKDVIGKRDVDSSSNVSADGKRFILNGLTFKPGVTFFPPGFSFMPTTAKPHFTLKPGVTFFPPWHINATAISLNIKHAIVSTIEKFVPGSWNTSGRIQCCSKELHPTCRIDVSKASTNDFDFLRTLKDKYKLCMVCSNVRDTACNTVGICGKRSYCYKGYDPDHTTRPAHEYDKYIKPAGLTFGCCDHSHSRCRSYSRHSLKASIYAYKVNYSMSVCSTPFCNANGITQRLDLLSKLSKPKVDGHWSSWGHWASCSVTCGKNLGHRTRRRTCTNPAPSNGGHNCIGGTSQTRTCGTDCPVNGHWGSWGHWGSCSVSCGKIGHMSRARSCNNPAPAHGGHTCAGSSTESKACHINCPVAGHWSSWGSYSSCSAHCGHYGSQTKLRTCTNPSPKYGGANCTGSSTTRKTCLIHCPVAGHWSSWGSYSTCSASCGHQGVRTKHRTCTHPAPKYGGATCQGSDHSTIACTNLCPIDGKWASWGGWGACSVSCGAMGHKSRHRTCSHPAPAHGGKDCEGSATYSKACHTSCPVDGHWGAWTSYSACSVSCCTGNQTRTRACDHPAAAYGGKQCTGDSKSTKTCTNSCKGDAKWTGWGHWSSCSKSCGGGSRARTRTCANQTSCTGACSGHSKATATCGTAACPIDGHWGTWTSYSACSVSCCTGNQTRTRACDHPAAAHGGKQCAGNSKSTKTCTHSCKGDAKWTGWGHWSSCSKSCGGGSRARTRTCANQTSCTGTCSGHSKDTATCGTAVCPQNGGWGTWTSYGACSVSCCSGNKTRTRQCNHPAPSHGGHSCSGASSDKKTCTNLCSGDAHWSAWGHWTGCSASCSTGSKTRTRSCLNQSACTGPCSGHASDTATCDSGPCPVNGSWSTWTSYGACSVTCCRGSKTRTRQCNHPAPSHGGVTCPGSGKHSKSCSNPCKGDAHWSSWAHWSSCSASCGDGSKTRTRTCAGQSACTGPCDGSGSDTAVCNVKPCPVNGSWGHWTSYGACSVSCCSGQKTRTRQCNHPAPSHGGVTCHGNPKQTQACTNPCKGDATWSSWGHWSGCSTSCAVGSKSRTRTCAHQSSCTGPCPGNATNHVTCDSGPCPVWSAWFFDACSVTCGTGTKHGIRRCSSGKDGDCSGSSTVKQTCNDGPCPINGGWGSWHTWGTCSVTCGAGTRTKTRSCDHPKPEHGGPKCIGAKTLSEACTLADCPRDGAWGPWSSYSACSVTCCTGHVTRTRSCDSPAPARGGHTCPGDAKESKDCKNPCKGDAHWSDWQAWGSCSASCGTGDQSRTRTCTGQTVCTGPCPGNNTSSKSCDLGACPNWSPWFFSACSATCGPGTKQGMRRCTSGHEEDCTGPSLKTESCNVQPCPVDGGWGSWKSWSACSKTCGDGARSRQRACDSPAPAHSGNTCPGGDSMTDDCKVIDCPHWGAYYEAGSCSVTCGDGVIQLERNCSTGNNQDCTGSPYDEKPCTRPAC